MSPGSTNRRLLPIVFVDDEADDIFFAVRALRSRGIDNPVMEFCDPEVAIEHFQKSSVDALGTVPAVVFCDVKMPGVMGFDVVRILRELSSMQKVPIWMLSGSDSSDDVANAKASGANGYIVKPAKPDQLAAVVSGQCPPESAFEPKGFLSV